MSRVRSRFLLVTLIAWGGCLTAARAQVGLGPEGFGATQIMTFGSIRLLSMGNVETTVPDRYSRNAAYLADYPDLHEAEVYAGRFDFDAGPDLDTTFARVGFTFAGDVWQLEGSTVNSDPARLTLVETPPLQISGEGDDQFVALKWGHRLSSRSLVGISVALHRESDTKISIVDPTGLVIPAPVGTLNIRATSDAPIQPKGRIGYVHYFSPRVVFSGAYTFFHQDITYTHNIPAPLIPAFGVPAPGNYRFYSSHVDAGLAFIDDRVTIGVEMTKRRTTASQGTYHFQRKDTGMNIGVEVDAGSGLFVRFGAHEGSPTAGLGYESGRWTLDYAYAVNREGDEIKNILGASRGHFLNLSYRF